MHSVGTPPECPALRSLRSAPQKGSFSKGAIAAGD